MAKLDTSNETNKPKDKYKVKNWSEYNSGLVKRGSLTLWLSKDVIRSWHYSGTKKKGGQYAYSDECIKALLSLKAVFDLTFRQLEGFATSLIGLMGLSLEVPCYTQLCRRQKGLKVPLGVSADLRNKAGLHIVIDSSGLKIFGEAEWKVRKWGYSKRRTWRKLHLALDETSGQIVGMTLTGRDEDDASQLIPLLEQADGQGLHVGKVGADGAYDTGECWSLLEDLEIEAIIPPKENAVYWTDADGELLDHARNRILEEIDQGGKGENLKGWKKSSGYHRRSHSENGFFRWKTIFGESMYARKNEHQQTEAAIKCAVLNRFTQLAKPKSVKVA
jgi:Transposase DDE domain